MSQPTSEQMAAARVARAMTDEVLASRVDSINHQPRSWDRTTKTAMLDEAARRLRWGTLREGGAS